MKAAARVIYRGSWETERPAIMKRYGWETSNSEVLISTPRRFGKTFSCAKRAQQATTHAHTHTHTHTRARALTASCRLAALPSSARALRSRSASRSVRPLRRPNWRCRSARSRYGTLSAVVFSPARRASRKLLERIVEQAAAGRTPRRASAALSCAFVARGRFVRLAGGENRICEYNQEACRLTAFDGRKSLIRSFPCAAWPLALPPRRATLMRTRSCSAGPKLA
jgi:hypothetical protein